MFNFSRKVKLKKWGYEKKCSFLCPVCKSQRSFLRLPNPMQPQYIGMILLLTLVFVEIFWNLFSWKGFFWFFPFWILFESSYRVLTRIQMKCPYCAFDLYLFLRDPNLAKEEMQVFWKDRKLPIRFLKDLGKKSH